MICSSGWTCHKQQKSKGCTSNRAPHKRRVLLLNQPPQRDRDLPILLELEPEHEAEAQVSSYYTGLCCSQEFIVFVEKIPSKERKAVKNSESQPDLSIHEVCRKFQKGPWSLRVLTWPALSVVGMPTEASAAPKPPCVCQTFFFLFTNRHARSFNGLVLERRIGRPPRSPASQS